MTERGNRPIFSGVLRLVPYSGVQFVNSSISVELAERMQCQFIEETFEDDAGPRRILLPIDAPPSSGSLSATEIENPAVQRITHPVSGNTVDPSAILRVEAIDAVAAFAGQWLPMPYLRFIGRDEKGNPKFDLGPANWARAYITTRGSAAMTVTLALDTAVGRQSRLDSETYLLPTVDDATFGSTFIFASGLDDVASLLAEPWFENWLISAYRLPDTTLSGFAYRHIAAYLTLLRLISATAALPEVCFTDTLQRRFPLRVTPIDLVLDIGDAETTALLVDVGQSDSNAATGYAEPLRIRDLHTPDVVHDGPFPTAVEFDVAPFGDGALSHSSGRIDGFAWPSLVRVGNEARRLALRSTGTEGVTGLSNLRSFLLDDTASPGLWRQSMENPASGQMGPMVSGSVLSFVSEDGTALGAAGSTDQSLPALGIQRPAIRPHFSRSSMIGFFAAEIVLHALAQANRAERADPDSDVRELRQIVVLTPTTLSAQERQALASRVEQGMGLVWRGLGWDHAAPGIPIRPLVTLGVGGDLGLQIAFLHNEVVNKYMGRLGDLMRIWRRNDISGDTGDTLRIASLDFGARTTSLAIVDYAANEPSAFGAWQPSIRFQERVPVGTDTAVQSLIWSLVLPAIERALAASGLTPARHFLDEITGRSNTSLLIEDPYFPRRLTRKILWPAGYGLLRIAQHGAMSLGYGNRSISMSALVELGGGRLDGVADGFDAAALRAGARGFSLSKPQIPLERGNLQRIVCSEMQQTIQQVARTITSNTCDLLLLAGEGVRLAAVANEILSQLPLPAGRIFNLETYANGVAAEALGELPMLSGATMLPAIAAAMDLKDQLAASGLIGLSISQLSIAGPSVSTRPIGASPRSEAQSSTDEPSAFGRAIAFPTNGG